MAIDINPTLKTRVTGYFNPFPYVFALHTPELNTTINLGPGQFICVDRDVVGPDGKLQRKRIHCNDPIFEQYVGSNKLAKQVGNEDIEIAWLPRPELVATPAHAAAFTGSQKFTVNSYGKVVDQATQQVPTIPVSGAPGTVSSSASSIQAMSISEARKRGIFKDAAPADEKNEGDIVMGGRPAPRVQPQTLQPMHRSVAQAPVAKFTPPVANLAEAEALGIPLDPKAAAVPQLADIDDLGEDDDLNLPPPVLTQAAAPVVTPAANLPQVAPTADKQRRKRRTHPDTATGTLTEAPGIDVPPDPGAI